MREDVLSPHAEELPPFKFLEERQLLDVVERVTLDQPVTQCYELNRALLEVESDSFRRESIVALLTPIVVLAHLKIVGITV